MCFNPIFLLDNPPPFVHNNTQSNTNDWEPEEYPSKRASESLRLVERGQRRRRRMGRGVGWANTLRRLSSPSRRRHRYQDAENRSTHSRSRRVRLAQALRFTAGIFVCMGKSKQGGTAGKPNPRPFDGFGTRIFLFAPKEAPMASTYDPRSTRCASWPPRATSSRLSRAAGRPGDARLGLSQAVRPGQLQRPRPQFPARIGGEGRATGPLQLHRRPRANDRAVAYGDQITIGGAGGTMLETRQGDPLDVVQEMMADRHACRPAPACRASPAAPSATSAMTWCALWSGCRRRPRRTLDVPDMVLLFATTWSSSTTCATS